MMIKDTSDGKNTVKPENMSEKEPSNPFEEIQKHLNELFKDANVKVSTTAFTDMDEADATTDDDGDDTSESSKKPDRFGDIRNFNLKPREIRDYLNRFVIRQAEAKKVLSVAVCDHYNHVRQSLHSPADQVQEYSKQNVLLLGPTGVGKTYLIKNIARLIGVPFVKADATKFSETGYVGSDVEDLVRDLVKVAEGDIELAEHGIIFIDEIDKIANASSAGGRDVSGRGVQINLLKLMEETDVNLFSPNDMMSQMQAVMEMQRGGKPRPKSINTRNILFIVSGAFDRLAEDVQKRLGQSGMGFGVAKTGTLEATSNYLNFARTEDFIKYGFEPEFIGRVPVRVACEALSADDLEQILTTSEGSILNQYRDDFQGYEISFKITSEALRSIAEKASREGTGARGLMTVLEQLFRDFKFELPSTAIKHFKVDLDTVESPHSYLEVLKKENAPLQNDVWIADIKRFASQFKEEHGYTLEFKPLAMKALIEETAEKDRTIQSLCEEKFKSFEHGLSIIHRNTSQTVFKIGKLTIQNPDKELSKWIVRSIKSVKGNH